MSFFQYLVELYNNNFLKEEVKELKSRCLNRIEHSTLFHHLPGDMIEISYQPEALFKDKPFEVSCHCKAKTIKLSIIPEKVLRHGEDSTTQIYVHLEPFYKISSIAWNTRRCYVLDVDLVEEDVFITDLVRKYFMDLDYNHVPEAQQQRTLIPHGEKCVCDYPPITFTRMALVNFQILCYPTVNTISIKTDIVDYQETHVVTIKQKDYRSSVTDEVVTTYTFKRETGSLTISCMKDGQLSYYIVKPGDFLARILNIAYYQFLQDISKLLGVGGTIPSLLNKENNHTTAVKPPAFEKKISMQKNQEQEEVKFDISKLSDNELELLTFRIENALRENRIANILRKVNHLEQTHSQIHRLVPGYMHLLEKEMKNKRMVFVDEALDLLETLLEEEI